MAMMKHEIIEFFSSKTAAEKCGEEFKKYFGYEFSVQQEGNEWKLIARTDQNLMG